MGTFVSNLRYRASSLPTLLTLLALPAALGLLVGCGSSSSPNLTPANVLFINASPDAPPLTLLIDQQQSASGVAYPNAAEPYVQLAPGTHQFTAAVTSSNAQIFNVSLTLSPADFYSLFATDSAVDIQPLLTLDNFGSVSASQAGVRFAHLSPNTAPVDVAIANGGAVIGQSVAFQQAVSYFGVAPGTYSFVVVPAGGDAPLASLNNLTVVAGSYYTLWLGGYTSNATYPLAIHVISHP